MRNIKKLLTGMLAAGCVSLASMNVHAWWNDDDYYDRWHDGPWYGGYPGYGWGGYPGYGWGGYPGYGWGGHPGYGYGHSRTIVVVPQINPAPASEPEAKLPR